MGMQGRLLKERKVTKTTYGPAQEEQEEDPVVLGQAQNIAAAVNLASNLSPQIRQLRTYAHYTTFAGGVGFTSFFIFNLIKKELMWNQLAIGGSMLVASYIMKPKNPYAMDRAL